MYNLKTYIPSAESKPGAEFIVDNGIITVLVGICDNRTQIDKFWLSLPV